ncbi:hypothetical protein MVEN_00724500 [Mycena venus]|uniref:Novel STAND NTPase 1 domain-containing protein n=1 Tax=Mycena venus TaxID=2733690 RepID=A0A8H6YKJ9_9AGAR|nr:hypothetical protein MVEN_00724500 [Mycena venus]
MPSPPTANQIRLNSIATCLTATADTLDIIATRFNAPFLLALSQTTQSLVKSTETVKQNKSDCADLMEQMHEVLNAIIMAYIKSDTGDELSPHTLKHIGRVTEQVPRKGIQNLIVTFCFRTLHKIHTFVETQQKGSKVRKFFRQGELKTLLKNCKAELEQAFQFFEIHAVNLTKDIVKMKQDAEQQQRDILDMIRKLTSDEASMTSRPYSGFQNSSNSISMLPSEPKIFHGRESELSDVLKLLSREAPRVAILGAGGIGKTSFARAVLHHAEIFAKYAQHRYFVACDSAANQVELAALIGAHLGLKPGKDLTQRVVEFFITGSPSFLILDNLETVWEPGESRNDIEKLLSSLADVEHLALMITMRGAERPAKVPWTRPFLPPLGPLLHDAAHQTFIDIAEDHHNPEDVDKILSLTDNMPLAINLIAHMVDVEGCSTVLSRWEEEKTSLISEGYDKRSNLELSISLSLSSHRIKVIPQAQDLLSLLSMLPNGLGDH